MRSVIPRTPSGYAATAAFNRPSNAASGGSPNAAPPPPARVRECRLVVEVPRVDRQVLAHHPRIRSSQRPCSASKRSPCVTRANARATRSAAVSSGAFSAAARCTIEITSTGALW